MPDRLLTLQMVAEITASAISVVFVQAATNGEAKPQPLIALNWAQNIAPPLMMRNQLEGAIMVMSEPRFEPTTKIGRAHV